MQGQCRIHYQRESESGTGVRSRHVSQDIGASGATCEGGAAPPGALASSGKKLNRESEQAARWGAESGQGQGKGRCERQGHDGHGQGWGSVTGAAGSGTASSQSPETQQ